VHVQADEYEKAFGAFKLISYASRRLFEKTAENSEEYEKSLPIQHQLSNAINELHSIIFKTAIQKGRMDEVYKLIRKDVMISLHNKNEEYRPLPYLIDDEFKKIYDYNMQKGQFKDAVDLLKYFSDGTLLVTEFKIKLDSESSVE
jgi:hypothetical protein